MRRRRFVLGCSGCAALALAGGWSRAQERWSLPPRLARPGADTDEGGWWAQMDREEQRLRASGFLIRDKALNEYVSGIACRLAGAHCPDLRVYLVRTPLFNAMMAPNGMMQIWSGLLLRMTNEAQLAAVIGHEMGHYFARHSIDMIRNAKSLTAFGHFLGLALGAVRSSNAGRIANTADIAMIAGFLSYNRDNEREADRIGLELMTQAGYAPLEASRVWEQLLEELRAGPDGAEEFWRVSILFATHPPARERSETLAAMAGGATGRSGEAEYRGALAARRPEFLGDELKRRRFGETKVLFDRLLKAAPDDGEVQFALGEAYRMRDGVTDAQSALDAYRKAAAMRGAPPELYRSMGLLERQLGQSAEARASFERYLQLKPNAHDAELIRRYTRVE
jgi:predicted Zn-dependent protease